MGMRTMRVIGATASAVSIAVAGLLGLSTGPASAAPAAAAAPAAVSAPAVSPTSPFGASINSLDDVGRLSTLLNRPLSSVRVFLNGIPTSWSGYDLLGTVPANATVALSFQSGTPAQVQTFLASRPVGMKCYASYWHEPEDNFTTTAQKAAYLESWHGYAPAIRAAGCVPTLILMKWTLNPKSGYNWRDWYPAGDVDVFAFDAYNTRAKIGGYGIPANYLAPILAASTDTGLPWALTELGSDIPAGTSPAERAAWAHGVAAAAAADPRFLFADWWDVLSPTGRDYSLDSATALAWNNGPATAPAAPAAVSVTAGPASAAVSWTPPADGGSPITGYIATATNALTGATTTTPASASATSVTVTGLTDLQSYTISLTATNAVGTSLPSAPSLVVPGTVATVPDAPTISTATPGNTTATLTWTAPASNGGSTITGYTITSVNTTTTNTAAGTITVGAAATNGTVTGLTNGQTYTLRVVATNALGDSPASAPSNPITPASLPGAPAIGMATPGNATASVTWMAPATDGGAAITGYTLVAFNASGVAVASTTTGASATSGTVSGLANGKTYTLKVTATNPIGAGPTSAPSNPVTPATTPDVPVLGAATGGVKTDTVTSATAWWQGVSSNGGSPVTGFRVIADHYQNGILLDSTLSAIQPASARSLQFPGLITAATYKFRVCAINTVGASPYSAPSNLVSAY